MCQAPNSQLGVVADRCHPSTGEAEVGGSEVENSLDCRTLSQNISERNLAFLGILQWMRTNRTAMITTV